MAGAYSKLLEYGVGPYVIKKETAEAYVDRIRFRHFKPDELEIAKEFVRKGLLPGTYFFDVYLPTESVRKAIEALPPRYKRVPYVGMLRIDAICYKPNLIWILEFKERFRPSGIGELMAYRRVFQKEFKPKQEIILGYIASEKDPDMEKVMNYYNIRYWVVRPKAGKYA